MSYYYYFCTDLFLHFKNIVDIKYCKYKISKCNYNKSLFILFHFIIYYTYLCVFAILQIIG